jgi:hypothetical protein
VYIDILSDAIFITVNLIFSSLEPLITLMLKRTQECPSIPNPGTSIDIMLESVLVVDQDLVKTFATDVTESMIRIPTYAIHIAYFH